MDKQKRQIIMAVVLAVVALGAGGYFVMTRERVDPNRGRTTQTGPARRKVRKTVEKKNTDRKRRVSKKKKTATKVGATRKVRKSTGKKTAKRRSKRRGKGTKIKKKEIKPAA